MWIGPHVPVRLGPPSASPTGLWAQEAGVCGPCCGLLDQFICPREGAWRDEEGSAGGSFWSPSHTMLRMAMSFQWKPTASASSSLPLRAAGLTGFQQSSFLTPAWRC